MTTTTKTAMVVPFNRPSYTSLERAYLNQALDSGHVSGDGMFTKRCENLLEKQFSLPRALLTTSCTDALEMTAILLNISSGDEVILPSFTFVSTANAFVLRGAKLVFADIRPDTLNIDEVLLVSLITSRTRAIVVVHYAGVACEMNTIMNIARHHQIPVVEDNAHGLFGTYYGKPLGTIGSLATQSFHETKNINCGEGGALLINDPLLIERAEIIREKGTNRARFFRGHVDKYSWVDIGSSYLPSEFNAAVLLGQLERADEIQSDRQKIWLNYKSALAQWAAGNNVTLPYVPSHTGQTWHMFYMLLPNLSIRTAFLTEMRILGIGAVFHYLPLHSSTVGRRVATMHFKCPITDSVSDRLVRLPLFYNMNIEMQSKVIEAVQSFTCESTS